MSTNAIRQLNSGGLKLNSNFSTRSVAANITVNRSSAAAIVKSGYNTFGTNALFTPARRIGGNPKYMSASQISRAVNGQNTRFVSGDIIPSYSGASYTQNLTMGTSNAYNNGLGVGATLNLALQLAGGLKQLGVFGGGQSVSKGVGDDLLSKTNLSNTAATITGNSDVSTLMSAINTAADSPTLRGAIADANGKVSEMEANTPTLQTETKQAEALKGEAQNIVDEATTEFGNAQKAVGEANGQVKGAEGGVNKAKSDLSTAMNKKGISDSKYIDARTNLAVAEQNKTDADLKYETAKGNTATAEGNLKTATQTLADAESKLASMSPTNADGTINPEYTKAQADVQRARLAKNEADTKYKQAQKAEQSAQQAAQTAAGNLTNAQNAETAAKEQLNADEKAVANQKDVFKEQEDALKGAQTRLNDAKTNQEQCNNRLEVSKQKKADAEEFAQQNLENCNKLQKHLQDINTLKSTISDANKKLVKLEKEEAKQQRKIDKEQKKNDEKIDILKNKHDYYDAETTKKEGKDWAKLQNAQEIAKGLNVAHSQNAAKLDATATIEHLKRQAPDFTVGGHEYISDYNGNFLKDGIPTTQADYDNAKRMFDSGG